MTTAVASSSSTKAFSAPPQGGAARSRRKQRCWIFHVAGITREGERNAALYCAGSHVRARLLYFAVLFSTSCPQEEKRTLLSLFLGLLVPRHARGNVLVEKK